MKRNRLSRMAPLVVTLFGLTTVVTVGGEQDDKVPGKLGPTWRVGDSWKVRAVVIQTQVATETGQPQQQQKEPVDWKFTVVGRDKIKDRPCHRVSVTCLDQGRQQPVTTLWFDSENRTLLRVEAKVLIKGQWRVFTETYVSQDGKPCPVLGPLPALPLDFPVFTRDGGTKNLTSQTYETIYGESGTKSIDDVGFAFMVDQSFTPAKAEYVKSLAPTSAGEGVVEVEIRGAGRRVSQLWEPNTPWPIYSNNGRTEARLLEVTRGDASDEEVQR